MTYCCCNVPAHPPPTHTHPGAPAACVLFTLLSLLSRSTGEYPTSELAFDRACVMWEEGVARCVGSHLFPQEAGPFGLLVHTPLCLLPPPLSLSPCVSPPLQPACTPDRQTDVISRASPALGLYHSPQTAHCLHTGCKFRLPLSL